MPLNVIAEVIANHGMAAWDTGNTKVTKAPPLQGTRIGTILMLAAVALSPLFFAFSVMVDGPGPLLGPVTLFLTGLCLILYFRTFREHPAPGPRPQYPVLPLPDRPSVSGFGPRKVNTSDMAEPPSVTDHTTQFFD